MAAVDYLAIDLGASNGRVLRGNWDGERFTLEELHRFTNSSVAVMGSLYWDVLALWREITVGLARYHASGYRALAGIGLDSWGVDVAFLDQTGRLLGAPYHYRDARTQGMLELVDAIVPQAELYQLTGVQSMPINTLYQLFSMVQANDPQLAAAALLLPIPNLFTYWLSGQAVAEYTHASTSQCLIASEQRWATELLGRLGIPTALLPPIVAPGTVLGPLRPEVAAETGFAATTPVIAVGCHDTASAVAAIPYLDQTSAFISSGTWSLMGVEVPAPLISPATMAAAFTNEGGVGGTIRLQKNLSGLWLVQECRRQWQSEGQDYSWEALLQLAAAAEPFACLINPDAPDFFGPTAMPAAIANYCIRSQQAPPTSVGATVRCCLESLAVRYRATLAELEALLGRRLEVVRVVGGGSRNKLLCQLTADACQRPVVAGPVEATALGNILVQALATGKLHDLATGRAVIADSVELERYEPQPSPRWDECLAHLRLLE